MVFYLHQASSHFVSQIQFPVCTFKKDEARVLGLAVLHQSLPFPQTIPKSFLLFVLFSFSPLFHLVLHSITPLEQLLLCCLEVCFQSLKLFSEQHNAGWDADCPEPPQKLKQEKQAREARQLSPAAVQSSLPWSSPVSQGGSNAFCFGGTLTFSLTPISVSQRSQSP